MADDECSAKEPQDLVRCSMRCLKEHHSGFLIQGCPVADCIGCLNRRSFFLQAAAAVACAAAALVAAAAGAPMPRKRG